MTSVKYHCFNSVKKVPNFPLQIILSLGPAPSIHEALCFLPLVQRSVGVGSGVLGFAPSW